MSSKTDLEFVLNFSHQGVGPMMTDLSDHPLLQPTPNGGNHVTWVAGHLAYSERSIQSCLTGKPNPLESWKPLFDAKTEPTTDASMYPSLDEVVAALNAARETTLQILESLDDAALEEKPKHVPPGAENEPVFQSNATLLHFVALHSMLHLGQVADCRRAAGRKPMYM